MRPLDVIPAPGKRSSGDDGIDASFWLVSFMSYDPGFIDLEQKTMQPLANPFGPRMSAMSQVRSVTYVSGSDTFVEFSPVLSDQRPAHRKNSL